MAAVLLHYCKYVVSKPLPDPRNVRVSCNYSVLKVLQENVSGDGEKGDPIATPSSCLKYCPLYWNDEDVEQNLNS